MKKPLIPVGLDATEALEYMQQHHFKNRHPSVGDHFGLVMTYYELLNKQEEKNNGREQEWRAEALKDAIHQDSGAAEDTSAVEDDSGGYGKQRVPSGVRDSISVSNDAGSTSPESCDTGANGGAESERRDSNGDGAGRSGVRDEKRPDPEAPLKDKLNYWRSRLIQREED